ncbi:white collar 1 protein [Rhodotorula toruloides]|uniref:White collar 1 n=1 Tax=Rhodotorula toruloides TaxID=5286 RepID=A0A2Z6EYX6_RHOTO|nr:white collar 1 [Rhodotorula toruloides]GEM07318.1 white collar 1 protein [Rhodotorula toruloides]
MQPYEPYPYGSLYDDGQRQQQQQQQPHQQQPYQQQNLRQRQQSYPPPPPPPSHGSPHPDSPMHLYNPGPSSSMSYSDASPALAPAYGSTSIDPIDADYGPQALSATSPSTTTDFDQAMADAASIAVDDEVDKMLQSSGLSGFAEACGSSARMMFRANPPQAEVVPRSYSYTAGGGGGGGGGTVLTAYRNGDGSGGGVMWKGSAANSSNALAEAFRQQQLLQQQQAGMSAAMDAFARLRAGSISITPSVGGQQQQQKQQLEHHSSPVADGVSAATRARLNAGSRTVSSPALPVLSIAPGAMMDSSRQSYSQQPQSPRPDASPRVGSAQTGEPYPSYDPANPIYDLYGSSYSAVHMPSQQQQRPTPSRRQSMQHPNPAPFSHNPTAPSDPYDPKALGLSMPPPRTNSGTTTSNSYQNIYLTSGFDLIGILARVVNRKNPTIEVGAVDMSCSFVVVDAQKFDQPIVYASETFGKLTGYSTEEIVGRNCRFLQAPGDQQVIQGEKRRYTDGNAAHHLRQHIVRGEETQVSLINYHKNGKPFINLVTCIPVSYDDSGDISFFVGFQVDLVDQPAAILDKMQNGSYVVNYSVVHATIARNPSVISFDPAIALEQLEDTAHNAAQHAQSHAAQAVAKAGAAVHQAREQLRTDDPSELIDTVATSGIAGLANETLRRQFMRLLVEQSDDLIHVLSLKGALLYVSDASKHLLEYEPFELLGKTLSSFCHPSDIVSVQRELKDAGVSVHPSVNLVFRIRRKDSGYVWFEAKGRLHLEPGKGRKCVILTGRPREVYKMSWRDLELAGGVGKGDYEFWAKICVDGIFLAATSSAEKVLGVSNATVDVVGRSVSDLSRRTTNDSERFMNALLKATKGEPTKVQHFMTPVPGRSPIEVVTRFYPARSETDPVIVTSPILTPVGGKQVAVIAQISLASDENKRARRAAAAMSSATSSINSGESALSKRSGSSSGRTVDTAATSAAAAATTASASSAGVAVCAPVVAAAIPGTGPPGLTSFSAVPSTFKALTTPSSMSDNVFDELNVTRGTSWQFELHQMRLTNKKLREEREALETIKKKKALHAKAPPPKAGTGQRSCANCGRTSSAEWRSGPTGPKTLCNACGLRWSKARSQAVAAENKRKEEEELRAAEAAGHSSSDPQSRSDSRDSTASGSGASTNPTTVMPSPMASYQHQLGGMSPHSPACAPPSTNVSLLSLYPGMSIAPSPSKPQLVHQASSGLQHAFATNPHAMMGVSPSSHFGHLGQHGPTDLPRAAVSPLLSSPRSRLHLTLARVADNVAP